jgi:uncharacterized protein YdiU (UPF0061 family)
MVQKPEAEVALEAYSAALVDAYQSRLAAKMGLAAHSRPLAGELLSRMAADGADFTNLFRSLSTVSSAEPVGAAAGELPPALAAAVGGDALPAEARAAWAEWLRAYRAALRADGVPDAARAAAQDAMNPNYIPRQHLLHAAIGSAEAGDFEPVRRLAAVLQRPYANQGPAAEAFRAPPPPELAGKPGVCLLSCSS